MARPEWEDGETLRLPGAPCISLFSEQVRGEPRYWYPMVEEPDGNSLWTRVSDDAPNLRGTKDGARRLAERYARERGWLT